MFARVFSGRSSDHFFECGVHPGFKSIHVRTPPSFEGEDPLPS